MITAERRARGRALLEHANMRSSIAASILVASAVTTISAGTLAGCLGSSSSSLPPDAAIDVELPDVHAPDVNLGDATPSDATVDATDAAVDASVDASADSPSDASTSDAPIDAPAESARDAGITTGNIVAAGSTTWPAGLAYVGTSLFFLTEGDPHQNNAGAFLTCNPSSNDCGSPTTLPGLTSLATDAQLTTDGTTFWFTQGSPVPNGSTVIYNCPVAGCTSSTRASSYSSTGGFWD